MPRANRYHIPGLVWHLTHRCHKRQFLLKFARDRARWLHWLFQAKKRYGLCVLDYTLTSNHIHLIARDDKNGMAIQRSMQLIAGRTAQEYNLRKHRHGAYWEDRYHATAVESGTHLRRCMVYIALNMVRAGAVGHPGEWAYCGYQELLSNRRRCKLITAPVLLDLLAFRSQDELREAYGHWIDESIRAGELKRESAWTESVAVGSHSFVKKTMNLLGIRALGREIEEVRPGMGIWVLHEEQGIYKPIFGHEKGDLR